MAAAALDKLARLQRVKAVRRGCRGQPELARRSGELGYPLARGQPLQKLALCGRQPLGAPEVPRAILGQLREAAQGAGERLRQGRREAVEFGHGWSLFFD